MLLMEASLIGVFAALDFFLWFVFWEGVLIPMYFPSSAFGAARAGSTPRSSSSSTRTWRR